MAEVNWGAIQSMLDAGWKNDNSTGTITRPDGSVYSSSGGKSPEQQAADKARKRMEKANRSTIENLLRAAGLDELSSFVGRWVRDGMSGEQVEALLYDPSSKPGKIVDRIYPELRLRAEAGKRFMPISAILEYKQTVEQVGKSLGLPPNYFSREAVTNLITGDTSIGEFKDRADEYAALGVQEIEKDPAKRAELESFERYYGVKLKPGEIAGMIFDTDVTLPQLKKQINSVRLDVAAGRTKYGDLTKLEAERLTDVGVDANQAVQGFGQLADSTELFQSLDGGEDTIGRADQLGAVFEGNSAARRRIDERARRRVAAFQSGGAFANTRDGFSGLGEAR